MQSDDLRLEGVDESSRKVEKMAALKWQCALIREPATWIGTALKGEVCQADEHFSCPFRQRQIRAMPSVVTSKPAVLACRSVWKCFVI
jgi:hypothetical protein